MSHMLEFAVFPLAQSKSNRIRVKMSSLYYILSPGLQLTMLCARLLHNAVADQVAARIPLHPNCPGKLVTCHIAYT